MCVYIPYHNLLYLIYYMLFYSTFNILRFYIYTTGRSYQLLFIAVIKNNFLFGRIVYDCSYFLFLFKVPLVVYFIIIILVQVSVLSCEHTCTMTQHYNTFQCFVVTAMKTHMAIKLILYYLCKWLSQVHCGTWHYHSN